MAAGNKHALIDSTSAPAVVHAACLPCRRREAVRPVNYQSNSITVYTAPSFD